LEPKKNIGLFMGILENEFCSSIMEGALRGAKECDVNLIVFPMDLIGADYAEAELNRFRYQYNILDSYMSASSLDGVIIEYGTIVSALNDQEKKDFLALTNNKPSVVLSEKADGYCSVVVDNDSGLIEVLEHLILDHKYTKIGYLSGTKNNFDAERRLQVYKDTLNKYDLYLGDDWIEYGNFSEWIEPQVRSIVEKHPDMEVLVCANDSMAIGAAKILRKMGIEPGKDIFLTGFDNIVAGFLNDPALTSVIADPFELACKAVHILIEEGENRKDSFIKTKMVKRESCGCCGFEMEEKWQRTLGMSSDWRIMGRYQLEQKNTRFKFETEMANITRELVFTINTEKEKYAAILYTLNRLNFTNSAVFLYNKPIKHERTDIWNNPDTLYLVASHYYDEPDNDRLYSLGDRPVKAEDIFNNKWLRDGKQHENIVLPLFFGELQLGLMMVETDPEKFLFAFGIAGQIGNTLYVISLTEEQARIKRELEIANDAKSRFLANMSHEIRTPINAIIGFNEMILRESKDNQIDEYASDVRSAAETLLMLINDILDFSKIEAGKMELVPDEYALFEMINNVMGMIRPRAEKKGLNLVLDFDRSLPCRLFGDSGRIQQILINLLSNAIKYTHEGTVTLVVSGWAGGDSAGLSFDIKDTGIGIKDEDIKKLFNEFERIDERRNRNIEGTGLGINITTGLLELMDSQLYVSSKYGVGSTFSFDIEQKVIDITPVSEYLKTRTVKKEESRSSVSFDTKGIRILVVDDNMMNRKVIMSLLKNTEMIVEQADGGAACIEMAKTNQYDMILLDHMMPQMDGIETLKILLDENIVDMSKTPVIALTANAILGAKEQYLQAGFTDYLSKPVLPKDLYAMMDRYIKA